MTQFLKTAFIMVFLMIALPVSAQEGVQKQNASNPASDFILEEKPVSLKYVVFRDWNDRPISFKEYNGSWVVMNLWATWCTPCVEELKTFEEINNFLQETGKCLYGLIYAVQSETS